MSSSDRSMRSGRPPGFTRIRGSRPVQISTRTASLLHSELKRQPEIRPDVVARARVLAADPNYPPLGVLRQVAEQILASPDLSEDEI